MEQGADTDGLGGFDVAGWVAASCARQGVPVHVTDAWVVARVAVLLGADAPVCSEPPERFDAGGVEGLGAGGAGSDDGVVQHGGDDGVAAVQPELFPLVS